MKTKNEKTENYYHFVSDGIEVCYVIQDPAGQEIDNNLSAESPSLVLHKP